VTQFGAVVIADLIHSRKIGGIGLLLRIFGAMAHLTTLLQNWRLAAIRVDALHLRTFDNSER
jgi:hypothetical protein